jgi:hypothetical protein
MTDSTQGSDDAFKRIRKAVEARDKFLREHPELQAMQDEITRLMRNMGTPHNRMALLDTMMRERILELQRKLIELREEFLASMAAIEARHAEEQPEAAGPSAPEPDPSEEATAAEGTVAAAEQGAEDEGEAEDQGSPTNGEAPPEREPGKILGPADAWPIPDGLTGRDRPERQVRGRPPRKHTPRRDADEEPPGGETPPGP